jgi:serine phosphatase RsbU (regulator of sigma subunit)
MQEQNLEMGYGIGCELIVLKINNKTHDLAYSSTGLNLYHKSATNFRKFKSKKATLNPDQIIKYIRTRKLSLSKGDAIFTHSDGITDQMNESGKRLKVTNLSHFLKASASISKEELIKLIDTHKGEEEQTDDIIGLYLKV